VQIKSRESWALLPNFETVCENTDGKHSENLKRLLMDKRIAGNQFEMDKLLSEPRLQ